MRFTLSIQCDNAAFEKTPASEIARILRSAAKRVEQGEGAFEVARLRDENGNTVGGFELVDDAGKHGSKPSARFTCEPGRTIALRGVPLVYLVPVQHPKTQKRNISPAEADEMTHVIVQLLNEAPV